MLKSDLVARLSEKMPHISVRTVNDSVNHLIQVMSNSLAEHQHIEIRGFGSFTMKHRRARQARNPKTGETMLTAEKFTPHFKPGKDLKDDVNASKDTHPLQEEQ
ncbi:MAG: integration host factor subunit beta [Gammaproteobacteria bacterium]|nr:integration host factor subunit beta [Gammaproteobacteria bacterium]